MASDKATTERYLSPNAEITFTGRKFAKPEEIGKFNSGRYKWVKCELRAKSSRPLA